MLLLDVVVGAGNLLLSLLDDGGKVLAVGQCWMMVGVWCHVVMVAIIDGSCCHHIVSVITKNV